VPSLINDFIEPNVGKDANDNLSYKSSFNAKEVLSNQEILEKKETSRIESQELDNMLLEYAPIVSTVKKTRVFNGDIYWDGVATEKKQTKITKNNLDFENSFTPDKNKHFKLGE
jgi:hypothetical protein